MQPPRPQDYQAFIAAPTPAMSPQALAVGQAGRRAMVDEYERLLAERFYTDPDMPKAPPGSPHHVQMSQREDRLRELHDAIFGAGAHDPRQP